MIEQTIADLINEGRDTGAHGSINWNDIREVKFHPNLMMLSVCTRRGITTPSEWHEVTAAPVLTALLTEAMELP